MAIRDDLRRIVANRWQLPLAVVALLVAGYALTRVESEPVQVPFDALLADVVALQEAGAHQDAADAAANLLRHEPPFTDAQRRLLHDRLAQILFEQEFARKRPHLPNVRLLLEHHERASELGRPLSSAAALRAGFARQWLGRVEPAISDFHAVLRAAPTPTQGRLARQALVELLAGSAEHQAERAQLIQELLSEPALATAYRWWALRTAIRGALQDDDIPRARKLLAEHGEPLRRSDLQGYYDYLQALVWTHAGEFDRALPTIARIWDWLGRESRVNQELDRAGFLPALTSVLAGELDLRDYRPQQALRHFQRALDIERHGDVLALAGAGRAHALAKLARHGEAREALLDVARRLRAEPAVWVRQQRRIRGLVRALHRERDAVADHANAIAYLEVALELTPTDETATRLDLLESLGETHLRAAGKESEARAGRHSLAAAGAAFEEASELAHGQEQRYAELLWKAAQAYDDAWDVAAARRLWRTFVERRAFDQRLPRALLALGKAYARDGMYPEAVEIFKRLADEFPRLVEAAEAQFHAAQAKVAMGFVHYPDAERTLLGLLESENVTPQAGVFRDALYALCDLYYEEGRYAEAISRMEDFLIFFPEDEQRYRMQFLLADAYRRSAYALRDGESSAADPRRYEVALERFQRAAGLFSTFAEEVGKLADSDRTGPIYERLALFYHGDCLFELNEPRALEEALATYRQAAARYQNEPAALTAQIQIANIHLRLGQRTEAARALERARWLLQSIPDHAFADEPGGMDRGYWERFLGTVRTSHLFRDVLADSR